MNSVILLVPIALPLIAGLICLVLPRPAKPLREALALATAAVNAAAGGYILLTQGGQRYTAEWLNLGQGLPVRLDLLATPFGSFVVLAASIAAVLIALYSLKYMADHARHREYYAYLLWTLGMAAGAALANDLIIFLLFWELLAVLLYALVSLGGTEAMPGANKTLIIIGGADLALLLGIGLLWLQSGTLTLSEIAARPPAVDAWLPAAAFCLLLVGALAKAGAMPLHSWIPAIAPTAPIPVMAYLPAALDKLLGIYLLARLSLNLFVMTPLFSVVLMALGAVTIVAGVLMALVQGDYRKMLAFHAVSQVGYMVMGIGTGVPVGVIGGLFHMLNNAIYKSCLFLCGGAVQRQTGRARFAELGGLAGAMPWTFGAALIAALAISGVPPLNGFASKWLIYQGLLDRGGVLMPLFLLAAMFGSALTLASFTKLLYSLFWGDRPKGLEQVTESSRTMVVPMVALALLCVVFGVFYTWPLDAFIRPILGAAGMQAAIPGIWQSGLATVLLVLSLIAGFFVYLVGSRSGTLERDVFLGGEAVDPETYRVPGTQFYGPIKTLEGLKQLYARAEQGAFDIYTNSVAAITWAAGILYQYVDQALSDLYREVLPALLGVIGQVLRALNARMILTYALWAAYAAGLLVALALPGQEPWVGAARAVAVVGMLGWGILALVEPDLRRFLVFAISSNAGLVVLGVTFSSTAALAQLISAGIGFAALVLACGSICRTQKTSEIEAMDGLAARMPWSFVVFLLAALWVSGLPPFGGFFSKYLLGVAAHEVNPLFSVAITGTAVLTLAYFLRPLRRFLHTAPAEAGA